MFMLNSQFGRKDNKKYGNAWHFGKILVSLRKIFKE